MSSNNLQNRLSSNPGLFWGVLAALAFIAAAILVVAPSEQTLGTGIRTVYIHVALTWTGMSGIIIAGVVGLAAAVLARPSWQKWAVTINWIALAFFTAGLIMSIIAAGINWGAVFWQEPRTNSALQIIALGLIVQLINSWKVPYRLQGILSFFLAVFLLWSVMSTPLVLHPGNAARTTPSLAIRFTFFSVFTLCFLAAVWIALWLQVVRIPLVQEESS